MNLYGLARCPFCGNEVRQCDVWKDEWWMVSCSNCRADGPPANTAQGAVHLWNSRGKPTEEIKKEDVTVHDDGQVDVIKEGLSKKKYKNLFRQ